MYKIISILGLAAATIGGAVAGTVTIPVNLTTSPVYVGTCTTALCTPTVSATNVGGTFENQLFGAVTPPASLTPSSSPQTVGPTQFILASQAASPNNDMYVSPNTKNMDTTIQIDLGSCTGLTPSTSCGLFNVANLYTMIQDSGAFGSPSLVITLRGVAANGSTPITDTIDLTAGVDYRSSNSSLGVTCTVANGGTSSSCAGATSDTAQVHAVDSNPGGSGGNAVAVYNNVFGPETSNFNFYLDVQELELGTNFLNAYLDSVTIANVSPSGGKAQLVFSGMTAETAHAPEPGTVGLLGLGFGLIAFCKFRRTAKS